MGERVADWKDGILRPQVPTNSLARERRIKTFVSEGRIEVNNSSVGFVVMLGAYFAVIYLSAGRADPMLLTFWKWSAFSVAVFWAGSIVEFVVRKPPDDQVWQHWIPRARLIMAACDVCVAASIWIILPAMTGDGLFIVLGIYLLFMLFQAIASTTATEILGFALTIVIGSMIGYCLTRLPERGLELSAVLAFFAVVIYAVRRFLRRAIVDALDLRFRAEASEAALAKAMKLVEAQRDDKTKFIAAASHDLRQPLHAASLYFEQALTLPNGALRARAVAGARSAFSSTQALLDVMLDHLRLEANAMIAKVADVTLETVITRVVLEHQAEARAAGMQIRVVHGSLTVRADTDLIKRILGNLVANAVRHAQGERILLSVRQRRGMAEVWVIDDGLGIAEADRPALFDDYARGSTNAQGGFGIGLASSRRMAAIMGGSIAFDPRWTSGAAFVVRVPVVERVENESARCKAA